MLWKAFLSGLMVLLEVSFSQGQEMGNVTPDALYEVGTDSAMRYLEQNMGVLRVTLLLQECGLPSLAQITGRSLPNSVEWFGTGEDASRVPSSAVSLAAQVTRAYLLGYDAGVRTEFRRMTPEAQEVTCSAAALVANDYFKGGLLKLMLHRAIQADVVACKWMSLNSRSSNQMDKKFQRSDVPSRAAC